VLYKHPDTFAQIFRLLDSFRYIKHKYITTDIQQTCIITISYLSVSIIFINWIRIIDVNYHYFS